MKWFALPAAAAGLLLCAASAGAAPGKMAWARSYAEATALARKSGRPVMVDFYTEWCGWCKRMDHDTFTDPTVIRLSAKVVPVKLDAEKEGRALAEKHGVTGFPTILFLDPGGQREAALNGYLDAKAFAKALDGASRAHAEFPGLVARVKANPRDTAAASRLLAIYTGRGDAAHAEPLLLQAEKNGLSGEELLKGYFSVAAALQNSQRYDPAIGYYRKLVAKTRDPKLIAAARMNSAGCFLQLHLGKMAVEELQAVSSLKGAPPQARQRADLLLGKLREAGLD